MFTPASSVTNEVGDYLTENANGLSKNYIDASSISSFVFLLGYSKYLSNDCDILLLVSHAYIFSPNEWMSS